VGCCCARINQASGKPRSTAQRIRWRLSDGLNWIKVGTKHMPADFAAGGFLDRENQISRDALIAVDALPNAGLAGVAAAGQLSLTTRNAHRFLDWSFVRIHGLSLY